MAFETTHAADVARLINYMSVHHQGRGRGIKAGDLAATLELATERHLRALVHEARKQGVPIVAMPQTGYFIASTPAELEEGCAFLHKRAMHSLVDIAVLRGVPLQTLLGQMQLNS